MAFKKNKTVAGTGADPIVRFAPLTIQGHTYQLAFDFNAIALSEAISGLNLLESLDFRNLNALKYRALLFAALQKAHPEIESLTDAGELITVDAMDQITEALLKAWSLSITKMEASAGNPPQPDLGPAK